jgi:hypothetical protein
MTRFTRRQKYWWQATHAQRLALRMATAQKEHLLRVQSKWHAGWKASASSLSAASPSPPAACEPTERGKREKMRNAERVVCNARQVEPEKTRLEIVRVMGCKAGTFTGAVHTWHTGTYNTLRKSQRTRSCPLNCCVGNLYAGLPMRMRCDAVPMVPSSAATRSHTRAHAAQCHREHSDGSHGLSAGVLLPLA